MKKLLVLGLVLGGLAAMTSCRKDYTCDCSFSSGEDLTIPLDNYKKSEAEDACNSAETTYQNADSDASCTLK